MKDLRDSVSGKKVMITGGLGMIGSTIACKLAGAGAEVTLVDACIEPYGANLFNIETIKDKVRVNIADIRDKEAVKTLVKGKDIIFNLAGQVSHNESMQNPFLDAEINYIGHLNVLECVRIFNPQAVVLHAGSRLQFGKTERVPVDETHPIRPHTPYALNKAAAENMYLFYNQIHRVPCVCFRIANPYGPRSQMKHSMYSMVNWFIRQAMEDQPLRVFGDGRQLRDYIYVEDLADAFIAASLTEKCRGEVFNVGSGAGISFGGMVETIIRTAKKGRIEYVPWPENYINVETGDYVSDNSKISSFTGWRPAAGFEAGVKKTVEYYARHRAQYWR
ncbi:MAG TPA: SDR family NAD(P)-dependent oxidoreductase [Elusimicrobiales bacterium]|mgnify:CR=1 FL=1|nr:SDR family NAD(P)-dependent oxidoreductase [Elusimicrobiales bacterium]